MQMFFSTKIFHPLQIAYIYYITSFMAAVANHKPRAICIHKKERKNSDQ